MEKLRIFLHYFGFVVIGLWVILLIAILLEYKKDESIKNN